MPINMTDYRMIINERVYNVLQIMIDFAGPLEGGGNHQSRSLLTQYTLTKTEQ